jgi:small subunit ribosomal protein S16
MAVKIRLRRTGRKKQPNYRLVVAESTSPRDGQYLDAIGTYNPLVKPAVLRIDLEKVDKWLAEGAEMTDTVASLVKRARKGGDDRVAVQGVGPEEKPARDVVEAPQAGQPKRGSRGAAAQPAAAAAAPEAPAPAAPDAPGAAAEAPTAEAPEAAVAEAPAAAEAPKAATAEAPAADASAGAGEEQADAAADAEPKAE